MRIRTAFVVTVVLVGLAAGPIYAQRGVGKSTGVARLDVKPDVKLLSGKVSRIDTGPCEGTTGRSTLGTHFLLETSKGTKLNIHLGPAGVVNYIANQLPVGEKVTVKAFRTENMQENHYVAQSLAFSDTSIQLRDENLRPFWARGNRARANRAAGNVASRGPGRPQFGPGSGRGPAYGRGQGQGRGPAYGQGRGQGQGRGPAYGRGQGQGRGPAYGQGRGQGQGRGPAYGRGQGQGRGPGYGRGQGGGYGRGYGRGRGLVDEDQDGVRDYFQELREKTQ